MENTLEGKSNTISHYNPKDKEFYSVNTVQGKTTKALEQYASSSRLNDSYQPKFISKKGFYIEE